MPSEVERAAAKVREWTDRRNQAIREAVEAGASLRAVAAAAGLSHTAIGKIVRAG